MTKARFSDQQPTVKVSESEDKYYIFICLNEVKKAEQIQGQDDFEEYIEYDYNEFSIDKELIDLVDVKMNPDEYLNFTPDVELEPIKKQKIAKSKVSLANYLETHPLFSTAKYSDGRYYNVTEEKQRQLTSKVAMYNLYAQQNLSYDLLKWNDTGDICEDWSIVELTQLAMEIDSYVTPLVEKQQRYEKQIQKASSLDEIDSIVLSFD